MRATLSSLPLVVLHLLDPFTVCTVFNVCNVFAVLAACLHQVKLHISAARIVIGIALPLVSAILLCLCLSRCFVHRVLRGIVTHTRTELAAANESLSAETRKRLLVEEEAIAASCVRRSRSARPLGVMCGSPRSLCQPRRRRVETRPCRERAQLLVRDEIVLREAAERHAQAGHAQAAAARAAAEVALAEEMALRLQLSEQHRALDEHAHELTQAHAKALQAQAAAQAAAASVSAELEKARHAGARTRSVCPAAPPTTPHTPSPPNDESSALLSPWRSMVEHGEAWLSMVEHGGAWRGMAKRGACACRPCLGCRSGIGAPSPRNSSRRSKRLPPPRSTR